MGTTKIEWTEMSWNPVVGCTKVSEGCQNCYAEKMAARLWRMGRGDYGSVLGIEDYKWNGKILCRESFLDIPLHWHKPRRIFVCSMGDLFHKSVPFSFIDKVVNVFNKCPQHTGQILTKRAGQLLAYSDYRGYKWPDNIIGMVTAENQKCADERIPLLLQCGFKTTGVSCEPLLGEIDLRCIIGDPRRRCVYDCLRGQAASENGVIKDKVCGSIDWVIVGGESGPKARPMHPDWARGIRDQCKAAGVPFFFKQWGAWEIANKEKVRKS